MELCSLAGSLITHPDLLRPTMWDEICCCLRVTGGVFDGGFDGECRQSVVCGGQSGASAVVLSCSPKSAFKKAG